jgi:hypothetical protein
VLRLLKWVEKVSNYGNWSKILGILEERIFEKIIITKINLRFLIRWWDCIGKRWY